MTNKEKRIKVINRSQGALAYKIDTLRVQRYWVRPGDYLNISIAELLELRTAPGGMEILEECLLIEDKEALKLIFPDREMEPEYDYNLKEIEFLLYEGSVEQLLDTLDYAPNGVLELIKSKAGTKLPNETSKIDAINEKFNINLNKINDIQNEKDIAPVKEVEKKKRRTSPITEKVEADIPKYNVISKED